MFEKLWLEYIEYVDEQMRHRSIEKQFNTFWPQILTQCITGLFEDICPYTFNLCLKARRNA